MKDSENLSATWILRMKTYIYDIRNMIEVKKIALPTAVYKAMMNFMDQVVGPYVFEDTIGDLFPKRKQSAMRKELWKIKSEQAFQKRWFDLWRSCQSWMRRSKRLQSELKPYLER